LTSPAEGPRRHLGLLDATAIYAGIILGSGIFVAPAAVAGAVPSIPAAFALWIAGGLVAACGASCYAECAARVPSNGGFFVFNREAYGPAVAFVGGWAAIFVTYPASIAAIALVFAGYVAEVTGIAGGERLWAAAAPDDFDFEEFSHAIDAIEREKRIKCFLRARKIALVESKNPTWDDPYPNPSVKPGETA